MLSLRGTRLHRPFIASSIAHIEHSQTWLSQVKGTAMELKEGAAKTGSQAAAGAEQAAASAQTSTSDSQQDTAQEGASQAESSGQARAGSRPEQGPDQAQGASAKAGAPGASSIVERLRSMASMLQREVRNVMALPDSCSEDVAATAGHVLDQSAWLHEHDNSPSIGSRGMSMRMAG